MSKLKMNYETKKAIVDSWLADESFRKIVEKDIGKVSKVHVDWDANEIRFYGDKKAYKIFISDVLEASLPGASGQRLNS